MLLKSFAPPLRTRLDGTTLKSASTPYQKSISPTYRSIQRLGRPKQTKGHLSPKIGDRWRLSQVDSHPQRKPITFPRAGPTHTSWANSPPEYVTQGGGGGGRVQVFPVSHRILTEIGWNFMLYY